MQKINKHIICLHCSGRDSNVLVDTGITMVSEIMVVMLINYITYIL